MGFLQNCSNAVVCVCVFKQCDLYSNSLNVLWHVQPRRRTNKRAKSVAAQIEQTKEGTIDLSPNSFLGKINLKVSHWVSADSKSVEDFQGISSQVEPLALGPGVPVIMKLVSNLCLLLNHKQAVICLQELCIMSHFEVIGRYIVQCWPFSAWKEMSSFCNKYNAWNLKTETEMFCSVNALALCGNWLSVPLQNLLNNKTFGMLPPEYQYKLIKLLPECDQLLLSDNGLRLVTVRAGLLACLMKGVYDCFCLLAFHDTETWPGLTQRHCFHAEFPKL